jgi:putative heme-binding domain-containing protein
VTELLDAVEAGQVVRADIDVSTRQLLSTYADKGIRDRVATLLVDAGNADRRQVLLEHQDVVQLSGEPTRGEEVFKKHCASCHSIDNIGQDIGPNLRSLTDQTPTSLLTSILDPSASVDGKYVTYIATTDDGRTFAGMVASETGNSITLVEQANTQHVLLRTQVEDIRSTGKSLMPDGLEKDISHQEFGDLISYIRSKEVSE